MYKFQIICITGLVGGSYYSSYTEALNAAQFRTNCTGIPWFVNAIKVRDN